MSTEDGSSKSIIKLLRQLGLQLSLLARKQVQLVQTETAANVKSETAMIIVYVLAAGIGAVAFLVIVTTVIIVLSYLVPLWLSALIVSAALIICSLILLFTGLRRSVRSPWTRTREVIRSDIKMAKEGFA
ncbi:MAG TPA: phage holin family protein [Chitinispirillaceae bacterium]|nr:phage holin family protein [Chitinispirillaceae bacterium]